jgi:hypothetical protein
MINDLTVQTDICLLVAIQFQIIMVAVVYMVIMIQIVELPQCRCLLTKFSCRYCFFSYELSDVLAWLSAFVDPIVFVGDNHIRFERSSSINTVNFNDMLVSYGLRKQVVSGADDACT